jgi:butyryl-CoA dehydrogenase
VVKGWISDATLRANHEAIQIHGGYGYTRDFQVEQIYRDNRLNPIHEGTNGIQGMDLLGRKVMRDGGAALAAFSAVVQQDLAEAVSKGFDADLAAQLGEAMQAFASMTAGVGGIMQAEGARVGLAQATLYLDGFGLLVMAWMHAKSVAAAKTNTSLAADYTQGKVLAAAYFYRHELSRVAEICTRLSQSEDTFFRAQASHF